VDRMKHEGNRLKDSVWRFNKNESPNGDPSEGNT